jgi:hypothetical protein
MLMVPQRYCTCLQQVYVRPAGHPTYQSLIDSVVTSSLNAGVGRLLVTTFTVALYCYFNDVEEQLLSISKEGVFPKQPTPLMIIKQPLFAKLLCDAAVLINSFNAVKKSSPRSHLGEVAY